MSEINDSNNKLFTIASNRMYSALNAYFIWKIINQSININEDGGRAKAEENLEFIINKYPYFFQTILQAAYKTFVTDITIFFDAGRYEDSFTIGKLLNVIEQQGIDISEVKTKIEEMKSPHGKLIS